MLATASNLKSPGPMRLWALKLQAARGHNKATVALADRLARIAWAVWRRDVDFRKTEVAAS